MNLGAILAHTPIGVWILLVFIVSRGVNALSAREIAPQRALIVPAVFLVWGVWGLIGSRGVGFDLALFVIGGLIGLVGGAALSLMMPTPGFDRARGMLAMPGSWVPLALIVVAFVTKYWLAVETAISGEPAFYMSVSAGIGGVFAGLFWGRTLTLIRRALVAAGESANWGDVVSLVTSMPSRRETAA